MISVLDHTYYMIYENMKVAMCGQHDILALKAWSLAKDFSRNEKTIPKTRHDSHRVEIDQIKNAYALTCYIL